MWILSLGIYRKIMIKWKSYGVRSQGSGLLLPGDRWVQWKAGYSGSYSFCGAGICTVL